MKVLINDYLNCEEKLVKVDSLKEASEKVSKIIDDNDLRSSEWYLSNKTGNVYDDNNVQIARISYNGRIWGIDEKEIIVE